jgi:Protein of unknown function (DUF1553)/Protein of unknown function (DUF1549)
MPQCNLLRSPLIRIVLTMSIANAVSAAMAQDVERTGGRTSFRPDQQSLWSFQPIKRPGVPNVVDTTWVRNPIDAFVLTKLEAAGLRPSPQTDKRQLIRRVTLDLIGLPPTPDDVQAFLIDDSPAAYEALVDRLLSSEQYGERWARPWLDLSRYAESDGFKSDNTRPNAWRFRDYVIRSLNADKPYDQFVREQLAGDEIAPADPSSIIATGFNRHWADEDNARNLVLRRQEILNDITDTTASVFLGLSLGCARCHDHKYDPITQRDYYRFQAFFAATQPVDCVAVTDGDGQSYREQMAEWEGVTAEIRAEMASIEDPVRNKMKSDTIEKFVPEVQEALSTEPAKRTPLQQQYANLAETHMDITTESMTGKMAKEDRERWSKLRDRLKEFDRMRPQVAAVAMVLTDVGRTAPKTHLLRRGAYNSPEEEVEPGILSFFDVNPAEVSPPGTLTSTGRRAALANWIASPDNPFTARVIVNRLWQGHFGRGLVGTPSDFGAQGDVPSHPELLDWLATELVARGWSLKAMHRLMVTSNTYCQSAIATGDGDLSEIAARAANVDPDNKLLWRMNRMRLDAEIIRDSMLAVSGQLNPQAGGPSIRPELPAGLSDRYGWKTDPDSAQRNRRSVYVFVRRNLRYPFFELFDMPDTNETCGRRNRTTTPPQALFVLNSELILNHARAMAGRLLNEAGTDQYAVITRAYELAFGRDPSGADMERSKRFLSDQAALIRQRTPGSNELALPDPMPPGLDTADGAAITDLCHTLLNANEFIYVD